MILYDHNRYLKINSGGVFSGRYVKKMPTKSINKKDKVNDAIKYLNI